MTSPDPQMASCGRLPDYARVNRAAWDVEASYVEPARRNWAAAEISWGIWHVPEAGVRALPPGAGGPTMIITDQASYSDQVFGLYWLLGTSSAPFPHFSVAISPPILRCGWRSGVRAFRVGR